MPKAIAPKISVNTKHVDRRRELVNRLNSEHPEYVHVFRNSDTPVEELELAGQEYVRNDTYNKDGDAKVMKWRRDAVARIRRDSYDQYREAITEQSAEEVRPLYKGDSTPDDEWKVSDPGRKVAKPKDPNEIGKDGGS